MNERGRAGRAARTSRAGARSLAQGRVRRAPGQLIEEGGVGEINLDARRGGAGLLPAARGGGPRVGFRLVGLRLLGLRLLGLGLLGFRLVGLRLLGLGLHLAKAAGERAVPAFNEPVLGALAPLHLLAAREVGGRRVAAALIGALRAAGLCRGALLLLLLPPLQLRLQLGQARALQPGAGGLLILEVILELFEEFFVYVEEGDGGLVRLLVLCLVEEGADEAPAGPDEAPDDRPDDGAGGIIVVEVLDAEPLLDPGSEFDDPGPIAVRGVVVVTAAKEEQLRGRPGLRGRVEGRLDLAARLGGPREGQARGEQPRGRARGRPAGPPPR